jgi:two-component system, NarL family, nitrate/nitrite response regulator NarL
MLTVSEDDQTLATALQRGASRYLLKTVDSDVLAEAIVRAARGEATTSPELTGTLVNAYQAMQGRPEAATGAAPRDDPVQALSPREQQILMEIARGASNKEIARTLDIAEATVKIHVQHILRKLSLTSRVQAAVYAAGRSAGWARVRG